MRAHPHATGSSTFGGPPPVLKACSALCRYDQYCPYLQVVRLIKTSIHPRRVTGKEGTDLWRAAANAYPTMADGNLDWNVFRVLKSAITVSKAGRGRRSKAHPADGLGRRACASFQITRLYGPSEYIREH